MYFGTDKVPCANLRNRQSCCCDGHQNWLILPVQIALHTPVWSEQSHKKNNNAPKYSTKNGLIFNKDIVEALYRCIVSIFQENFGCFHTRRFFLSPSIFFFPSFKKINYFQNLGPELILPIFFPRKCKFFPFFGVKLECL